MVFVFLLEMPPGNIGCIGEEKLKTRRPKERKVDIPAWLRKVMVAWPHTSWGDRP